MGSALALPWPSRTLYAVPLILIPGRKAERKAFMAKNIYPVLPRIEEADSNTEGRKEAPCLA